MKHTSLSLDKELNSLTYETFFYVKQSGFWPTL